jgi:hypothetical protein
VHDTRLGSREDVRALGYEVSYGGGGQERGGEDALGDGGLLLDAWFGVEGLGTSFSAHGHRTNLNSFSNQSSCCECIPGCHALQEVGGRLPRESVCEPNELLLPPKSALRAEAADMPSEYSMVRGARVSCPHRQKISAPDPQPALLEPASS